jgi:hypothetical protein
MSNPLGPFVEYALDKSIKNKEERAKREAERANRTIPVRRVVGIAALALAAGIGITAVVVNYIEGKRTDAQAVTAIKAGKAYMECTDELTRAKSQLTSAARPEELERALNSGRCVYMPK